MDDRDSYREGMAAYHAGRYEDVIRLLTSPACEGEGVIRLMARFYLGQAHYRLAVRLFDQRRFRDAGNHFREAARINPSGGGVARFLAGCYVGDKGLEQTAQERAEQIKRCPEDVTNRVKLALAQWKLGQPGEAVATLREGVAVCPDSADLWYQLGVVAASDERFDEARDSFVKAVGLDPSHAAAHERLAQCHAVSGNVQTAMEELQKAHDLDPDNARIAAQISVLAGVVSSPNLRPRIMPQTGGSAIRYDAADIDRLGEAVAAEPDFVEAFLRLPDTEVDREVFTVLRATIERALDKHPEFADLHYHCGQVYHRLGRDRNAIHHVERAVELNPRYVDALILLARLYGQTDRWASGVERLQQAIEAGADYPDVHYLVGQLYQKGNRPQQAREAYMRALSLKSDYRAAREALESLSV
jgi:tetratricopeptide (TPR) repeat protein